jgi:hypothetical protein
MAVKGLSELYSHFVGRTNELVRKFGTSLPVSPPYDSSCPPVHRDGQKFLIMRLHCLWAAFCQGLVTRSALGNTMTLSGSLIPRVSGISRSVDVQRVAMRESNGRQPPWHDTGFTIRVASTLALANYNQISMSIGAVSPIRDLVDIRNYIAHPNNRTITAYQRISTGFGVSSRDPIDILTLTQPGGATLFETWVSQLQIAAQAAVH